MQSLSLMAISKLKRWFLDRSPLSSTSDSIDKLSLPFKTHLIISPIESVHDIQSVDRFISMKAEQNISIDCLFFSTDKSLVHENLIDIKMVKWTGEPKCQLSQDVLNKNYDLVYLPSFNFPITIEYIMKNIKARMKAGYYSKSTERYLDLMLETNFVSLGDVLTEIDVLIHNLKNYE